MLPPEVLDQDILKTLVNYDPITGIFTWRERVAKNGKAWRTFLGREAGRIYKGRRSGTFYRAITINHKHYMAHRLAYLYMTGSWPDGKIDHRDRDGLNNKWSNLRPATISQNNANQKVRKDNISGYKGVSFDKRKGLFYARINHNRNFVWLGYHQSAELAHAAYTEASNRLYGEYARAA